MSDRPGIEQAVFGPVGRDEVDSWLTRHLRACLGAEVAEVLFRSGRVAAVFGCRLDDGQEVAVKVHRAGVDASHLAAAVSAQRHLARAGYPCPEVLHGPCITQGRTAVVETLLPGGAVGDGHRPPIRAALAASLAEQVQLLRTTPAGPLRTGAPPWARYEHGPWPTPHDPIFDFRTSPAGYAWLDRLAARAAEVLSAHSGADVVAHSDWSCGNVRFSGDEVCASFDWDSLAGRPEPVLAGMAAGSHTEGSAAADAAAAPAEVAAFLVDYQDARGRPFGGPERAVAAAAACWVLAYNARCGLAFTPDWARPADGSPLAALTEHREDYLDLGR